MEAPLLPIHVFSERYQPMLIQLAEHEAPNASKNGLINSPAPLLRTRYGLQINVSKNNNDDGSPTGVLTLEAEKQPPVDEGPKSDDSHQPYHYRLIPDWHTSYLWYDTTAENYHGDPVVEDYTLDARYPGLAPLYWIWQGMYEEAFEKQGLHLGYRVDVFPHVNDQVAWEVAGFFIAIWLILQDNVESIHYAPSRRSRYHIRGDNVGEVVRQFLNDENALLNGHAVPH